MSETVERYLIQKKVLLFTVPWLKDVRTIVDGFNACVPSKIKRKCIDAYEDQSFAISNGVSTFPTMVICDNFGQRTIHLPQNGKQCLEIIRRECKSL